MKIGRIIKSLASIKLGIAIIVAIGGLAAWGTLVEAHYNDSAAAQKIVYGSIWMYIALGMLCLSLTAVMIDRWPWKEKHTGFVLAHIGIITIIVGSLITKMFGIDGSLSFGVGETSHLVATEESVLAAYASLGDVSGFRKIGEQKVDFFTHRPSAKEPFVMPLAGGNIEVTEYLPYAFREDKVVETQRAEAGPGVRFQLQNPHVSLTEWLVQPAPGREVGKNLGPAQVILTSGPLQANLEGRNGIVLRPHPTSKAPDELQYEIHTAREPKKIKRGLIHPGDTIETGWMGLVLRVLKFLPKAEEVVEFKPSEQMTPVAQAAVKIHYNGEDHWLGANSMLKLFTDQAVYIVTYGNHRKELDFGLTLKNFKVGRYQGTMRAASYESLVSVPGVGDVTISMNEPLKYKGYTFYQASFQEDEQGRPTVSVLSVNRDPGRWIKYLGSLLIVFGTIHLFYFKSRSSKAKAKPTAEKAKSAS